MRRNQPDCAVLVRGPCVRLRLRVLRRCLLRRRGRRGRAGCVLLDGARVLVAVGGCRLMLLMCRESRWEAAGRGSDVVMKVCVACVCVGESVCVFRGCESGWVGGWVGWGVDKNLKGVSQSVAGAVYGVRSTMLPVLCWAQRAKEGRRSKGHEGVWGVGGGAWAWTWA